VSSARSGPGGAASGSADSSSGGYDAVENTRIAARLLGDLPPAFRGPKHDVLACYVLIASRTFHKGALDEALGRLGGILERDPDNAPALLALATAFMVSRQIPKARNQLKRMLKLPFDSALADEFVLGWLMLADVYADGGKLDQAQEALQRAIALDGSCGRAYEFLGGIAEKELRYAEAAECYEKAWRFDNEQSAPVGYKLAFNYLKAARFVEVSFFCVCLDVRMRDEIRLPSHRHARRFFSSISSSRPAGHRRVPQGAQGLPGLPADPDGGARQGEGDDPAVREWG
jgi:tetratricopeptide (TPR) repeat protein